MKKRDRGWRGRFTPTFFASGLLLRDMEQIRNITGDGNRPRPSNTLKKLEKSMMLAKREPRGCDNQVRATVHMGIPMAREDIASEFVVRALRHLLATNPFHFAAMKSLKLRPAGLPIADFDRINAPHGWQVRSDLAPLLVRIVDDRVTITALGEIAVDAANEPPWHADA